MKTNIRELRKKNIEDLKKELVEKTKTIEKFMMDVYKGKEKNLVKSRTLRKEVARIKTLLAEKANSAQE
ncbi:50S ribosomal protein L29 [Patescibacteria group bacterium]|nr:50S ribosomal protein L29 [Patescibacteria group bacterium]